ncbi:hypothetical protein BDA99DRAFT_559815 [Phascolomyces articulosus]|uniref:Uncharacterized protein n=1 Tax=Phascolomyces articulosus TaxID=60185 RepID=A0AAD5K097_9FUNG|nr:hypothetical protein BDA99DRAFT_559815 [Phascolomyces articulosus]
MTIINRCKVATFEIIRQCFPDVHILNVNFHSDDKDKSEESEYLDDSKYEGLEVLPATGRFQCATTYWNTISTVPVLANLTILRLDFGNPAFKCLVQPNTELFAQKGKTPLLNRNALHSCESIDEEKKSCAPKSKAYKLFLYVSTEDVTSFAQGIVQLSYLCRLIIDRAEMTVEDLHIINASKLRYSIQLSSITGVTERKAERTLTSNAKWREAIKFYTACINTGFNTQV